LCRLVHPFPSALDAVATGAIALIAGAEVSVAARLAVGMLGLQFAIGAANDLADAPLDGLSRPRKPIPAGLVELRQARVVLLVAAIAGLSSAASVGSAPLAVGICGLADGLVYDLRLKGTVFAALPFAAGVALLPVYAWLGATGGLPAAFWGIVPMALLAGAVLAVANALADIERDRLAGVASVATILGRDRAIAADAAGLAFLQLAVVASSAASGPVGTALPAELAGLALGWVGLRLSASPNERVARLGWEVQAVGIVAIGAGWLAVLGSAGLL
jgi:4-hydroxybenzoate polyprenyltransferase